MLKNDGGEPAQMTAEDWGFHEFKDHFLKLTGLNLHSYKERQMERRIRQFIDRGEYGGFAGLFNELKRNGPLLEKFMGYLTINTSGFFRDPAVYEYLKNTAMPELLRSQQRLNCWSMGCSTGEEPYTLALIADQLKALDRVRILASDIDERALRLAAEGRYTPQQVEKVPPSLLHSSFEEGDGFYRIGDRYRKVVSFCKHNFLEPIYSRVGLMHLILCRNVFIYFKSGIQEWIIGQAAAIIAPGGYFVTGCSEFITEPKRFGLERKTPAIYKKSGG